MSEKRYFFFNLKDLINEILRRAYGTPQDEPSGSFFKSFRGLNLIRSALSWFLVGLLTIILFFPVLFTFLTLFPFDRDRKNVHPFISFWARIILVVCPLMRVHFEGTHYLKRGAAYVLVANHQSVADIIAVLHLGHPFKFIAKRELFWIPFLGWALSLAGYIPLIRGDSKSGKEAMQKASGYLKRGVSVLLFPEGTRSRDGQIQNFKAGAFMLAAELDIPIVPIVIQGTRDLIPKGKRLLARRVEVRVQVGAPHVPKGRDASSIEAFCDEVRSEMIASLSEVRARPRDGFAPGRPQRSAANKERDKSPGVPIKGQVPDLIDPSPVKSSP